MYAFSPGSAGDGAIGAVTDSLDPLDAGIAGEQREKIGRRVRLGEHHSLSYARGVEVAVDGGPGTACTPDERNDGTYGQAPPSRRAAPATTNAAGCRPEPTATPRSRQTLSSQQWARRHTRDDTAVIELVDASGEL